MAIITKIINNLLLRFPLFGNVIAHLEFKLTSSLVPAPIYTDGHTIYYKKDFLEDYTDDEKEFLVAHEIMHIVLNHIFRNPDRDPDLLNYVEDAIINQLLIKCGMTMPEGGVYIEDALDYSVDELYMKYLPKIDEIKEWMQANTYHDALASIDELLDSMYSKDLAELMEQNNEVKDSLMRDIENGYKKSAKAGLLSFGMIFPSVEVGKSQALLSWKELLKANIQLSNNEAVAFYEVEPDGIIKREYKPDISNSESEVVIDTSSSMPMAKIKAILRECKHILENGELRVGFCDVEFYGWNEIYNDSDIDELEVTGRGGTNFEVMAQSFTDNIDNKIVITDGYGYFPKNRPDILWVILDDEKSFNHNRETNESMANANYIFIDENMITVPSPSKKMLLEQQ